VPSFRNVKHCENFSYRHWYQTSYCMVVVWPTPPVSTGSNGTGAHAIKSIKKSETAFPANRSGANALRFRPG
jgi:hypothetical protein